VLKFTSKLTVVRSLSAADLLNLFSLSRDTPLEVADLVFLLMKSPFKFAALGSKFLCPLVLRSFIFVKHTELLF